MDGSGGGSLDVTGGGCSLVVVLVLSPMPPPPATRVMGVSKLPDPGEGKVKPDGRNWASVPLKRHQLQVRSERQRPLTRQLAGRT